MGVLELARALDASEGVPRVEGAGLGHGLRHDAGGGEGDGGEEREVEMHIERLVGSVACAENDVDARLC